MKKILIIIIILCIFTSLAASTSTNKLLDDAMKNYILGDFKTAKEQLNQVLTTDPTNQKALNLMDELNREMSDLGVTETKKEIEIPQVEKKPAVEIEPIEKKEPVKAAKNIYIQKYQIVPDYTLIPSIDKNNIVTFGIKVIDAKKVSVVGEFNKWDKNSNPLKKITDIYWQTKVKLEPGKYKYRYCIDDEFIKDPNNPVTDETDESDNPPSIIIVEAKKEKKQAPSIKIVNEETPVKKITSVPSIEKKELSIVPDITIKRLDEVKNKKPDIIKPEPQKENFRTRFNLFNTGSLRGVEGIDLSPRVFSDGKVQFTVYAPDASEVYMVGDFNNWQPQQTPMVRTKSGIWVGTVMIKTGSYGYNYIIDGKWVQDPDNKMFLIDKYGNRNSLLNVETGAKVSNPRVIESSFIKTEETAIKPHYTKDQSTVSMTGTDKKNYADRILRLYNRLKNIQEKLKTIQLHKKTTKPEKPKLEEVTPPRTVEKTNVVPQSKEKYISSDAVKEIVKEVIKEMNIGSTPYNYTNDNLNYKRISPETEIKTSHIGEEPVFSGDVTPSLKKIVGVTFLPFQSFGFSNYNYWISQRITDYLKNRISEKNNFVVLNEPVDLNSGLSLLDYIDTVKGDIVITGSILWSSEIIKVSIAVVDRRSGMEKFKTYEFTGKEDKLDLLLVGIESTILSEIKK